MSNFIDEVLEQRRDTITRSETEVARKFQYELRKAKTEVLKEIDDLRFATDASGKLINTDVTRRIKQGVVRNIDDVLERTKVTSVAKLKKIKASTFRKSVSEIKMAVDVGTGKRAKLQASFTQMFEGAAKHAANAKVLGITSDKAFNGMTNATKNRVRSLLTRHITTGRTIPETSKAIASVMDINERAATRIARTNVNAMQNEAHRMVYESNPDVFIGYRWSAIFDARTSSICARLDGTIYPLGSNPPGPPAHPNCRSTLVGVFRDNDLEQEMRNSTKFARNLQTGKGTTVPARQRYEQWLRDQDNALQDRILGSQLKGKLWRAQRINLDDAMGDDLIIRSDEEVVRRALGRRPDDPALKQLAKDLNVKPKKPEDVLKSDIREARSVDWSVGVKPGSRKFVQEARTKIDILKVKKTKDQINRLAHRAVRRGTEDIIDGDISMENVTLIKSLQKKKLPALRTLHDDTEGEIAWLENLIKQHEDGTYPISQADLKKARGHLAFRKNVKLPEIRKELGNRGVTVPPLQQTPTPKPIKALGKLQPPKPTIVQPPKPTLPVPEPKLPVPEELLPKGEAFIDEKKFFASGPKDLPSVPKAITDELDHGGGIKTTVKINELIPTQEYTGADKVRKIAAEFDPTKAEVAVIEKDGKLYIYDGHHTAVAARVAGKDTVAVRKINITPTKTSEISTPTRVLLDDLATKFDKTYREIAVLEEERVALKKTYVEILDKYRAAGIANPYELPEAKQATRVLNEKYYELRQKKIALDEEFTAALKVPEERRAKFNVKVADKWKRRRKKTQEAFDQLSELIDVDAVSDEALTGGYRLSTRNPKVKFDAQRAYHSQTDQSIHLSSPNVYTMYHEWGHQLEQSNPKVRAAVREFLERRTRGESAETLRKLTGSRFYGPEEIAKPDKFFSPYVGRIYTHDSTEVLSMGLERMALDPVQFYKDDREHFELITRIIRGEVNRSAIRP